MFVVHNILKFISPTCPFVNVCVCLCVCSDLSFLVPGMYSDDVFIDVDVDLLRREMLHIQINHVSILLGAHLHTHK